MLFNIVRDQVVGLLHEVLIFSIVVCFDCLACGLVVPGFFIRLVGVGDEELERLVLVQREPHYGGDGDVDELETVADSPQFVIFHFLKLFFYV